jgi:hypothetical protein
MKTIIHVNQNVIKSNVKNKTNDPGITVKNYKENNYCHEVVINGPCRIISRMDKPLKCGARIWIETDSSNIELIIQSEAQDAAA